MSSNVPSALGTPAYEEKKNGGGIIVASDVLCPFCKLRAPTEGVHPHCENQAVLKSNMSVIETNQKAIESNTVLTGAVQRLVETLQKLSTTSTMTVPSNTATFTVTTPTVEETDAGKKVDRHVRNPYIERKRKH